jgi:apolipoprotein N-acyltransferase
MALAAVAGAAQTLSLVHTQAWPLPLLAVAVLAWLVASASPRRAAVLGWVFSCSWLCAGTWWLFISLHRYGGLPSPLAAGVVLLLSGFLAIYLAVGLGWAARMRSGHPGGDALRFAAAWLLAELARAVIFTGFPWGASGYTQIDGPLAWWAPWLGVYGMGAVLAWIAASLALGLRARWVSSGVAHRNALVAALVVLLGTASAGLIGGVPQFTQASGNLQVSLLQTNVAQDEKFAAEHLPDTLGWVATALTQARGDLVVGPETAVPLLPDQLVEFSPDYWPALVQHFQQPGMPAALVGVPLGSFEKGYSNSVLGLSPGAAYRYDKTHLVPFGEFIPTGFRWFTELMNIPLGDFDRGPRNPPSFAVRGQRVAPNICYEDLFGEEIARRFGDATLAPTVLANVGNIGWFGDTVAVPQHLNISRLRALEFQRPMLRATNTGATAVIDHRGQVTASLPAFTRGVLVAQVQGREGLTPFARWASAWGLWPLWALGALVLLWPHGKALVAPR